MQSGDPSFIDTRVAIRTSPIAGKGMVALALICEGEVVLRWGGAFLTQRELRGRELSGKIVIQVDDDLWSIEERSSPEDDAYFVNHHCDSNFWMTDGRTFVTRRDSAAGEEITVDYALFESESYRARWTCLCGSPLCRTIITGKDYLLPELQKRYRGHFSPVIEKKLAQRI